jgi:predicted amidohydrolase YtcJ
MNPATAGEPLVIGDVLVEGYEGRVDVLVRDGSVVRIRPARRPSRTDGTRLEGRGGALLPGLHDHHVHLTALAAEPVSVRVGPDDVHGPDGLRAALNRGAPGEWVRATGYHESVAGPLDRHALDRIAPDRPVRVQHRSGELWILNTRALHALSASPADHGKVSVGRTRTPAATGPHGAGTSGRGKGAAESAPNGTPATDGRIWRGDEPLRRLLPPTPLDLPGVGARAAARGVTGFTHADPHPAPGVERLFADALPQHVLVMGLTATAPVKLRLDDLTLPAPDELAATIAAARPRPVAVHCVTRVQLFTLLLALDLAGPHPGDRVEHAALVPAEALPWLRRLGVTVVTQPHFPAERAAAHARELPPEDLACLYRCRTLADAGIPLAAGTDAPYGTDDPWAVLRAAVAREPGERLTPRRALDLFLGDPHAPGRPRRVAPGIRADLCLLHTPLGEALGSPGAGSVRATFVNGRLVHGG